MSELKTGDVVWLKSGGPSMTISGQNENKHTCAWFDSKGELQHGIFAGEQLTTNNPYDVPPTSIMEG